MKQFFHVAFCPPNDNLEVDGHNFTSRLNDKTFKLLKDAGINKLLGWGWDSREETIIKTLKLCEKYNIDYYLQSSVSQKYLCNGYNPNSHKAFAKLNNEELAALDNEFIQSVEPYSHYKALKGIIFEDECAYLSYPGVLHAKEVFEKTFPNLEFYTNFFGIVYDYEFFWYSSTNQVPRPVIDKKDLPFELKYPLDFDHRIYHVEKLIDGLMDNSKFLYNSFDQYPFENHWPEYPQSVTRNFFDLIALHRYKKAQYKTKSFTYLPVGSWYNKARSLKDSEYNLIMHVSLSYGLDGFAYFPVFYPLDFVIQPGYKNSDNGDAGIFDINGKTTRFFDLQKENMRYLSKIQNDILSSKFIGIKSYGTYYNGRTIKDINTNLKWPEAIFTGDILDYFKMENQNIEVKKTTNNVLVSVFKRGNNYRYYLTNTSTYYENEIEIKLPEGEYRIYQGKKSIHSSNEIRLTLQPGQGLYIKQIS